MPAIHRTFIPEIIRVGSDPWTSNFYYHADNVTCVNYSSLFMDSVVVTIIIMDFLSMLITVVFMVTEIHLQFASFSFPCSRDCVFYDSTLEDLM